MKALNKIMLKSAHQVAKSIRAQAIFLFLDATDDDSDIAEFPKGCPWIAVTKKKFKLQDETFLKKYPQNILLPPIELGRVGLIKVSMAFAISTELVKQGDKIVFLCGSAELTTLDTLTVFEIGKESEIITTKHILGIADSVQPQVFETALNLAMELAIKGREGKPVGTIFVLGDEEKVMQLSKQMIINPFRGYPEEERNILNPALKETIREFAALDGAFVISSSGTLLAAGRYLGASADAAEVERGLGSRHFAGAGITALSNAIALVVSESTGDVRIYKNGSTLMAIEKP